MFSDIDNIMFKPMIKGNKSEHITAKDVLTVHQAVGAGYAKSKPDEIEFIKQVALATGVVLDPVYSVCVHFVRDLIDYGIHCF